MIVYVDMEHARLREYNPEQYERQLARRLDQKYRFEDLSGDHCLLVRYHQFCPDLLREVKARAVLVSGAGTDFEHYDQADLAGLRAVYREAAWPVLGLCAGHQLMAETYGAPIDSMGRLAPGEPDPYAGTQYPAGERQERGFKPVQIKRMHPLLEGFEQPPVFLMSHYWEAKSVPEGFSLYASSDMCAVQLIAHDERPLFGTQFHPEAYDDEHPDGRRLLENFFRVAGVKK